MRMVITHRCANIMCDKVHVEVIENITGGAVLLGDETDDLMGEMLESVGINPTRVVGMHVIEDTEPLCMFDVTNMDVTALLMTTTYGARRIVS